MLNKMIGTFIRRPVFTTMFVLLLVVFGIKSYPNLGVDLYPDVELPLVSVTVTYTGASPEEMETLITRPIEDRVSQVAGIKTLSSTVREGYSQTTLEFELGVDPREMCIRDRYESRRSAQVNVQAIVKRMFHTKPSKIVGVDIGTGSIKMVQIETGSKPVVSCFAVAELPLELINNGFVRNLSLIHIF